MDLGPFMPKNALADKFRRVASVVGIRNWQIILDANPHAQTVAHVACWHLRDVPAGFDNVRWSRKTGSGRASAKPTRLTQDIDIWPGFSFEAPAATSNVDIAAECLHHTLPNRLAERCERFRQAVPGKFSVMSDASPSGWPLQI